MKLIIFDLDGVLVDLRATHYQALNRALVTAGLEAISQDDHFKKFNGLSTRQKLGLLGIPSEAADRVYQEKQKITHEEVLKLTEDRRLKEVLKRLKGDGYILACASNSVRLTVKDALLKTGLLEYIDFYVSNEDVKHRKPSPEIYYHCMILADAGYNETIIVEDGEYGKQAALKTGAKLIPVTCPEEVTYELLS